MGAHSTLRVSRKAALKAIRRALEDGNMSDETISGLLDELLYSRLYNVSIVSERDGEDDAFLDDINL